MAKRFSLYNANPSATLIMPNVNIKDIGRDISSSQLMVADTTGWVWRVKSSSPQQQKVVNVGSVFGVAFGADSQILVVEGNQVTHRNATSLGKESSASVPNSYCTMLAYAYSQFYRHCGVQGSGSSQYHRVQLFSDTAPNATFVRELPASLFATGQGGMEVHTTTLWIIGTGSGTDKGFMVEFLLK